MENSTGFPPAAAPSGREEQPARWLPLRSACRLLEVNQSTLRQWADRGLVRVFRTPGGHRRFLREDVLAVLSSRTEVSRGSVARPLGDTSLHRIRRRLHAQSAGAIPWFERFGPEGKARLRLLGRRLLEVATSYLSSKRHRAELLEEARVLGEVYGQELARGGLPLREVMEGFVFFRDSFTDSVREAIRDSGAWAHTWQQAEYIAGEMLLAMTRGYERSRNAGAQAS
ncbi:MAG: helix-turn-helix domain-containing protein [Chloroflexi bacterium]|nr:helix-turn-helix domain-containing protein [Chloroflexota bacterium]